MAAVSLDEAQLIEFAKRVELNASRVLEGMHRSLRGGDGLEFHSAIPYSQGEDIRRIDWKRFAASDRLYVRKFEREEKAAWQVFLDQSQSMLYENKYLKSYEWSASLALLSKVWGDPFQAFPEENLSYDDFIQSLVSRKIGSDYSHWKNVEVALGARVVLISDFFLDLQSTLKWVEDQRGRAHSFHFVQIVHEKEREFSFDDVFRFEDMESSEHLTLDANVIKKSYKREFEEQQALLKGALKEGDSFVEHVVGQAELYRSLLEFFEGLEEAV